MSNKDSSTTNLSITSSSTNSGNSTYRQIDEQVFLDRQKEIAKLSKKFNDAVDKMLAERPIVVNDPHYEEEEYEYVEEEEEEEEVNYNGEALILIHEIDLLSQDIHQLVNGLPPKLVKSNQFVKKIEKQLNSLVLYLTSLRIRAEGLLSA
jgi:hypothetical protein